MKMFTKLVESLESNKYYKVLADVELVFKADNEGETGYLADSELGSLENHSSYTINNIEEITIEEYNKSMLIESIGLSIGDYKEGEETAEDKILSTWNAEFGDRPVTSAEKMEFYHKMREAGFDSLIIANTLENKISSNWMKKNI